MPFTRLVYEKRDGIVKITFNRPEILNALDRRARLELLEALRDAEKDEAIRVVILTGAGDRAFSAGADVRIFKGMTPAEARRYVKVAKAATNKLQTLRKPVIAMINGFALGGGLEIVLACDLAVAADSAKFGQTELNLGLVPGAGGTQRLPQTIGVRRAKQLIFTGEQIDAMEALQLGIVNQVVPAAQLEEATMALVAKLMEKSPVILRFAKQALNEAMRLGLREGLNVESKLFAACFATKDSHEGISAFLEKRRPTFKGR